MGPHALEARQAVAQLGQLYLQPGLWGLGPPGEDVHDQLAAVDHGLFRDLLNVAFLRRAQVVVGDDKVDVELIGELGGRGDLARPDPGRRVGPPELLDEAVDNLDVGRL